VSRARAFTAYFLHTETFELAVPTAGILVGAGPQFPIRALFTLALLIGPIQLVLGVVAVLLIFG